MRQPEPEVPGFSARLPFSQAVDREVGFVESLFKTSFEKSKDFDPELWEHFPASPREFIESREYCDHKGLMYECHIRDIEDFVGEGNPFIREYDEWIDIEGIGGGKSWKFSVLTAYYVHCILCLRNPQKFLGELGTGLPLAPRTKLAIMNCSVTAKNAKAVVFGEIKNKIDQCHWFHRYYPPNPRITSELQFDVPPAQNKPKDMYKCVYVIPGSSSEYGAVGFNMVMGLMDEAAFYPVTEMRDTAEEIHSAISSRITSRIGSAGILVMMSSPMYVDDFMERRFANEKITRCKRIRRSSWTAKYGVEYDGEGFWFDPSGMTCITSLIVHPGAIPEDVDIPERAVYVHREYYKDFYRNPDKSWRVFGAIPSTAVNRFFSHPWKIEDQAETGLQDPVLDARITGEVIFEDWFGPVSGASHFVHVDASSMSGKDATGIALCHVAGGDKDGPVIQIDLVLRLQGSREHPIPLKAIRTILFNLRDVYGFKIGLITYDGWQSADAIAILAEGGFSTAHLSVDKTVEPYTDVKEMIYEDRLVYYLCRTTDEPLLSMTKQNMDRLSCSEVFVSELMNVEEVQKGGRQIIDHSPRGSKDVSDAVAGAVHNAVRFAQATTQTHFEGTLF